MGSEVRAQLVLVTPEPLPLHPTPSPPFSLCSPLRLAARFHCLLLTYHLRFCHKLTAVTSPPGIHNRFPAYLLLLPQLEPS